MDCLSYKEKLHVHLWGVPTPLFYLDHLLLQTLAKYGHLDLDDNVHNKKMRQKMISL